MYEERHSFVWKYASDLIEILSPKKGERILDLGCGPGHLALQIAASGARVIGIDGDLAMIAQARKNYPDLRFDAAEGEDFHFADPFDAVFSNATLHWIREPDRVVACVREALRPGGRFVAEFGGKGNVQNILEALFSAMHDLGLPSGKVSDLWYTPDVEQYSAVLEKHGLRVTSASLFDRLTPLEGGETGMRHWIDMFAGEFLRGVPARTRSDVIRETEDRLRPRLFRDGRWFADYRRIRVTAVRE